MSIAALLVAARDQLRVALPIPQNNPPQLYVGIQPADAMPSYRGEWYVALDEESVSSAEKIMLREEYTIAVKISKRVNRYAPDRYDQVYTDNSPGLDQLERRVIAALHNNQHVRALANKLAGAPSTGGGDIFQTPIWYRGRSRTTPGDESLERALSFYGGLRVQAVDIMG